MTSQQVPPAELDTSWVPRIWLRRSIIRRGVLLAMVAALMLLGACGDGNSDPRVPPGAMSSIEGFAEASATYDTESMRAYLTDDFTWQSTGPVQTLDGFLAHVDRYWENTHFYFEASGEPVIHLEGDTYVAEVPGLSTGVNFEQVGTTVYRIVEVDNIWLIHEIRWVNEPTSESTD